MTLENYLKEVKERCNFLKKDMKKGYFHPEEIDFVVHSRQDVPALVEMVEMLLGQRNEAIMELDYDNCGDVHCMGKDIELESLIPTKEGKDD